MRITPEARKAQLLDDLDRVRNDLLSAATSLPPEKRSEVFLGVWNVHDLIAHLIGWDYTNIQAAKDILADQLPQFYAHHDRDWQTYNAQLVREYAKDNWDDLLAGAADSHAKLLSFLKAIPAEEFDKDRGIRFRGWKVTIARLLQAEAEDEATHAAQVAAFNEQIQHETAPDG
jgi:hypothetical protein